MHLFRIGCDGFVSMKLVSGIAAYLLFNWKSKCHGIRY